MQASPLRILRFGDFALDPRAGELRKHGVKIRLQDQSLQILLMLLERRGEVVLRDEIRTKLWPNNTIVEFDHSINAAIKRLRNALGESAEKPRFIETLAKRGYRFTGEAIQDQPNGKPESAAIADADDLTGKTFANYRLLAELGAGGMGLVYRAEDLKLGRQVAVKFLPSELASDPTARQRFEREARAASALNHPGICAIYGLEDLDDQPAIVMELVEGETLEARMARGRLSREQAVALAVQIADALAEAHRKGIIHRDLKPSNVMLTERSTPSIKILDFGIAKMQGAGATLTRPGQVAGTMQYMSPEQAEGKPTDSRSDIYSFGVVLNEMLTGGRAHEVAASGPLERLVRRCLEHDREERWQSAKDLKVELEWIAKAQPAVRGASVTLWPWIGVAILAVVAVLGWMRRPESVPAPELSFTIAPPSGKELAPLGGSSEIISPDGSTILFRTRDRRYYVRRLNSFESELLPEWPPAGDSCWAPDSQLIGFLAYGGRLMKLRIPKGAPEQIAQNVKGASARGATWNEQGIILMAHYSSGLFAVPATGGTALPVEVPGLKGGLYFNPQFLPGGEDFLFEFDPADFEGGHVYMATLRGGKAIDLRLLLMNDTAVAFTPAGGGRVLYVRNDNLYSQKLDQKARKLVGGPELVQERVASYAGATKASYFSISNGGTLAWRSGTAVVSQITVFDRKGNRTGIAGIPRPINVILLSPDESRLMALFGDGNMWFVDANGPGQVPLHFHDSGVFWSPDGGHLICSRRDHTMYERRLGDSSQTRELGTIPLNGAVGAGLTGVSSDGRRFLFSNVNDLSWFALDGKRVMERIVEQRVDDGGFSPDGTWVVYHIANVVGVFARPVSGSRVPVQLSNNGLGPVWRADGKEILYHDVQGIWSVAVEGSGDELKFSAPVLLFSAAEPMGGTASSRPLAVSRDGSRIFYLQSPEQPDSGVIKVRTGVIR